MNKLIFVFTILFFTSFAANAQNQGTQSRLLEVANEYIKENPDDEKAKSLLDKTIMMKAKYTERLDILTDGNFSITKGQDQKKLEREAVSSDPEAASLKKALKQTFAANNKYFEGVSVDYKNIVTKTKLKMDAKKSKKKAKMKKKKN